MRSMYWRIRCESRNLAWRRIAIIFIWRLWKDDSGQLKQRIVFVDPHGILRTGIGDEKIKDVEARLSNEVELESVIISPPKTSREIIEAQWRVDESELHLNHVFFMSDQGLYVDQVMNVVRK